jgi:hypothetical protein
LVGVSEEKKHFKDPDVGGRRILEWILRKQGGEVWIQLVQDRGK